MGGNAETKSISPFQVMRNKTGIRKTEKKNNKFNLKKVVQLTFMALFLFYKERRTNAALTNYIERY